MMSPGHNFALRQGPFLRALLARTVLIDKTKTVDGGLLRYCADFEITVS